jgi:hypothetical protein
VAGFGSTHSQPTVAWAGNSSVVSAEGPERSLQFYWQTIGAKPWNPELVAGKNTTYAP